MRGSRADPLDLEGILEQFLPECTFRGRQSKKLQYAVLVAAAQRAYAAAIPTARFQLLTATGHSPQLETPDQVDRAIWTAPTPTSRPSRAEAPPLTTTETKDPDHAQTAVTRVTHSCHLIETGDHTFLTDPWFSRPPGYHQSEPIAVGIPDLPRLPG